MPASKINDPAQDATIRPEHDARPSKTQRKKQSHALQSLGERLVELTPSKLALVPLPEQLREAVEMAQRIRAHEGRRRQMQYIGRLMREADADAISQSLAADSEQHRGAVTAMHAAERWRDGLIDASLDLTTFIARYPNGAAAPLASLVTSARRERAAEKAPRQARLLYRELHRIIAEHDLDIPDSES